ncbi:copper-binding protein [Paraburkholderia guartelaensis]|uniref:Copper-binding protein n=1 Tax=Paraburkholderia guartelaensis TaxID=2546446 RepID=A0ABU9SLY8_9BURK
MKKMIVAFSAIAAIVAAPAFAGDDMAGMSMSGKPSATKTSASTALTDAEVKNVDTAAGMVTLSHGALENVGMPPMTMAFKAKDAAMARQVHEGDKVKVRVENVNGTMTIVMLEKRSGTQR